MNFKIIAGVPYCVCIDTTKSVYGSYSCYTCNQTYNALTGQCTCNNTIMDWQTSTSCTSRKSCYYSNQYVNTITGNCTNCSNDSTPLSDDSSCACNGLFMTYDQTTDTCLCPTGSTANVFEGVSFCKCDITLQSMTATGCVACAATWDTTTGICICANNSFNWTVDNTCATESTCLFTSNYFVNIWGVCKYCGGYATVVPANNTCLCANTSFNYNQSDLTCHYKCSNSTVLQVDGTCGACVDGSTYWSNNC